ncbi:MAG: hypothetical protein C5B49_02295 [Bdellovibrio sp.]|nr:MAG: hypothetical protein C5B49_02295 [Bdellovibrio sp.]
MGAASDQGGKQDDADTDFHRIKEIAEIADRKISRWLGGWRVPAGRFRPWRNVALRVPLSSHTSLLCLTLAWAALPKPVASAPLQTPPAFDVEVVDRREAWLLTLPSIQ